MVQKTVVLCEGVHDLALISILLERSGRSFWSKKWKEIESYSKSTPEATIISEFKSRRGHGVSFLIKQDKNVDFCVDSFWGLYEDYEGYDLKFVTDSDGDSTIRKIKDVMIERIRRDVIKQSDSLPDVFCFKNADMKPAVFLYPKVDDRSTGKLTEIVKDAGFGNLAGCRDDEERKRMLESFVDSEPEWIKELEIFLIE